MKLLFLKAKETYNSNKYIKVGVRVLISLTLIVYLVIQQDATSVLNNLLNFNLLNLFVVILISILGTYISAIRWNLILKTSDKNVSILELFILYIKGYFYNNFLPTQMGGDVYKAIAVGNIVKDQSLGFFSVFMDRFGGLIILLLLGLFGITSILGTAWVVFTVIALIAGIYLYFPVLRLFAKRIKFFQKFEEASNLLLKNKKESALIILTSLIVQVLSFTGVYILFLGLNTVLPMWSVIAFMPIASLSSLIPSFNGFGTQETVYAYLFQNAGVTAELSIAVSVMLHVVRLIMSLIGGLLILFNIPKK